MEFITELDPNPILLTQSSFNYVTKLKFITKSKLYCKVKRLL